MKRAYIIFVFLFLFLNGHSQAAQESCGIENCHGIDIVCGPNVPQACTEMYAMGDFCRQYARCEIVDGKCGLVPNPVFEMCTSCVRECSQTHIDRPVEAFNCEAKCRDEVESGAGSGEAKADLPPQDGAAAVSAGTPSESVQEGNAGTPCI